MKMNLSLYWVSHLQLSGTAGSEGQAQNRTDRKKNMIYVKLIYVINTLTWNNIYILTFVQQCMNYIHKNMVYV